MKRLLCVFAHPDDECYGPGGTIARAVLDGTHVFITCFTAGEAGTIGISKTLARDELAKRRQLEFENSCAALGVAGHRMLGAPDHQVSGVDAEWAVREILADIERVRPQVVITFHHLGVSGHPDHVAVAGFLDQAFARAGDEGPQRYYGFGLPRSKALLYQRSHLVPLEDDEVAARVAIPPEAMERKVSAIRAHVTQLAFYESLEAQFDYREVSTPEHFELRRVRGARPDGVVTDLFDGVDHGGS